MKAFHVALVLLILAVSVALAGCSSAEKNGTTAKTGVVAGQPAVPTGTGQGYSGGGTIWAQYANLSRFVGEASDYAKERGREAALREFNDVNGSFIRGDLYVFAYDMNGTVLAWPYRPDMIGTNRAGATDPNGVKHIARMIELAREGGGPVYYITANPANNNRSEFKLSYIKPVDSTWFVGAGIYLPEIPAQFSATERDGLVARVNQAREYAEQNGAAKAIKDFNDRNGTFAYGSRYIFAYGYNGTTLALPFQPEVIGTDRTDFTDTYGVKITEWEIAVAKDGGGFVYVNYLNPDTGKPGMKLCYVEPAGDSWFVGSGIYTDRL
jgi:signal transduction histidine kinase